MALEKHSVTVMLRIFRTAVIAILTFIAIHIMVWGFECFAGSLKREVVLFLSDAVERLGGLRFAMLAVGILITLMALIIALIDLLRRETP